MSDAHSFDTARQPNRFAEFWFYFSENRGAVAGLSVFVSFLLVALLADVIAPHSPTDQFRDHLLQPPVWQEGGTTQFLLGTDPLGRDMLSRLLHGARYSFFIGLVVVVLAVSGGVVTGRYKTP